MQMTESSARRTHLGEEPIMSRLDRRDLLKLMGVGGVVCASRLFPGLGCASVSSSPPPKTAAAATGAPANVTAASNADFFFMQLSDTHWGFSGAAINPNASLELGRAVAAVNGANAKPDFLIFTGDLTHSTDDVELRRTRMGEFKQIVSALDVPVVRFMPGEHDAAADAGAAYQEFFGAMHYAFDHKGIHFIALDNVSDPTAKLGDAQLSWLHDDLARIDREAPIVVFTHRPLWDLKPEWDWTTADGAKALEILMPYRNLSVFFGHIHQELHHSTEHIAHHAARSLIFALPPPETPGKRAQVPWDPAQPEKGLGYRRVEAKPQPNAYALEELPLPAAGEAEANATIVPVSASRWAFEPETITLRKDVPVILELRSTDVHHGFSVPGLNLRADVVPDHPTRMRVTPKTTGTFPFHCDYFCGSGHEGMSGQIIVT
jgi:plastocyanin